MHIAKMFGTIKFLHVLILLTSTVLLLSIVSEFSSFSKLENLQRERDLASSIYSLTRDDLDLANIQLLGDSNQLQFQGAALLEFFEYDYVNKFSKSNNYQNDLSKLEYAIKSFTKSAKAWFTRKSMEEETLTTRQVAFVKAYHTLINQLDIMTYQNITFEKQRFIIQLVSSVFLLLLALYTMLLSVRRFSMVKEDMALLNSPEQIDNSSFNLTESEYIAKHIGRKSTNSTIAKNSTLIDELTNINNNKGFMQEASSKKSLNNYNAVCILAIDGLSDLEVKYPKEFSEALIKKMAFMLTLYRQPNDTIARIDHNKFAIFLSREDKETAFNDCDLVRQSIQDTPFKTPDNVKIAVTLSGGFVQKTVTQKMDDIVTKASKVLLASIKHGGNRIAQLRD